MATVECLVGVLKHDLHCTNVFDVALTESCCQIFAIQYNMAAAVRTVQTKNEFGDGGFACTRLANEAECFTNAYLQRHIIDNMNRIAVLCEGFGEMIDVEQPRAGGSTIWVLADADSDRVDCTRH